MKFPVEGIRGNVLLALSSSFFWVIGPGLAQTRDLPPSGQCQHVSAPSMGFLPYSIVVNEIQYAPGTGEPEWVEIMNATTEAIDVGGWYISDAQTSSKHAVGPLTRVLPGGSYAILTGDTVAFRKMRGYTPGYLLPVQSFPSLNNTGDAVVIFDRKGGLVDSVQYLPSWGGGAGITLERIDPLGPSTIATNWSACKDSLHATPGRSNSMVIQEVDLQVADLSFPGPGSAAGGEAHVTIRNAGRRAIPEFSLNFFDDVDGDSAGTGPELLMTSFVKDGLQAGDTTTIRVWLSSPVLGLHSIVAEVVCLSDTRSENNRHCDDLLVSIPPGSLCVNEIMYEPQQGEAEYVEVCNNSAHEVELRRCSIADRPTAGGSINRFSFSQSSRRLRSGEYCVVASDSTLMLRYPSAQTLDPRLMVFARGESLGLNNDGDCVVVRSPDLTCIDSVAYSPQWHNPEVAGTVGRSLEKIAPSLPACDPRSWSTSVHPRGGTPGGPNSVYTPRAATQRQLSVDPNPFSPDGDGYEDFAVIRYELPLTVGLMRLRIFDVRGRIIRTLQSGNPVGARGEIAWDGRDEEMRRVRIGIYIILMEVFDQRTGTSLQEKGTVVVAGRL